MRCSRRSLTTALALLLPAAFASAQEKTCPCPPPEPPPPVWRGSLAAGLALTGGNSDTRTYNLGFGLVRDAGTHKIFKADGFYLRADNAGDAIVDRTALGARYEQKLSGGRYFGYGELRHLRDRFKGVDYLITPTLGAGVRLIDRDQLKLVADGGLGLALEKIEGFESTTKGALHAGESLVYKLSPVASLSHAARGLWKLGDLGNAYYHVELGLIANLTKHMDLRVAFADDLKTRPQAGTKKNDTSLLVSFAVKTR